MIHNGFTTSASNSTWLSSFEYCSIMVQPTPVERFLFIPEWQSWGVVMVSLSALWHHSDPMQHIWVISQNHGFRHIRSTWNMPWFLQRGNDGNRNTNHCKGHGIPEAMIELTCLQKCGRNFTNCRVKKGWYKSWCVSSWCAPSWILSLHSKSLHSLLLEAISRNCNAQAVKIAVFISTHTNCFKSEEKVICYQFSLENNLPTFRPNAPVVIRVSRNVGKLFSELKLVTDNLLFIYAEASWEATESLSNPPTANRLSRHSQCLLYDCLSGLHSSCCERHMYTCTELISHI